MTLSTLITKLERSESGSRELDAEIDATLRIGRDYLPSWARENFPKWRPKHRGTVEVVHNNGVGGLWWDSQPFTTSLDAAVALVNRLLPGAKWEITTTGFKPGCTIVCGSTVVGGAYAATPALAVIAAALRALSKDTDHETL